MVSARIREGPDSTEVGGPSLPVPSRKAANISYHRYEAGDYARPGVHTGGQIIGQKNHTNFRNKERKKPNALNPVEGRPRAAAGVATPPKKRNDKQYHQARHERVAFL